MEKEFFQWEKYAVEKGDLTFPIDAMGEIFLINVKENGEMLTHNSIKFLSRIIRDDLHIPFKFHNLRHTYATILAESVISPRYVQEMLGHSKLEFTLKYYTHITGHMADMARMAIDEKIKELAL